MEIEIQRKRQADAREVLYVGRFYWTNASFPLELDCSKNEYTNSPLRSFQTLPPLESQDSKRQLLRVSTNTTIIHKKPKGGKPRGKKRYNYGHPCYLVEYDKSTNQGVIFLGTSKEPNHPHRFAIVHSRSLVKPLLPGSLGTIPPYSFREEKTYLNFSHPLRVRFAYFPNDRCRHIEIDEIPCDGHEPPFVAVASFATQPSDDGPRELFVVFDQESKHLFWKKHMEYHRNRPGQLESKDDSGGAEPDDGGSSSGGAGPSMGGARPSIGGTGPSIGGVGSSMGGAGPSTGGAGPSAGEAGPSTGRNTSGTGWSLGSVGSSRADFSSCEDEDAPWGRVGDQRIGIDIPLVTEDICSDSDEDMDLEELGIDYDAIDVPWGRVGDQRIGIDIPLLTEDLCSDSDEEMCLEELVINYDAIDAPWGQVGDQHIGINVPLVIEDICPDSNEEMDSKSIGKLEEVFDITNVVELESSSQEDITIWPTPNTFFDCTDVVAGTPKHYLIRTTNCMKRISLLLSDRAVKFNQEQCKYLAGKLDTALQSARSVIEQINTWYFSSASPKYKIGCLEIFKLLLLMGLEAEGFIQDCYKDEWIQNAIMLTNVSEHVASMGFNLELCTTIFSSRKSRIPRSLTPSEVTNLHQAEAGIVKTMSDLDERKLCVALSNVTRLGTSRSTERQLATFLLGRLGSASLAPGTGSIFSMKSLKQMEILGRGASSIVHRAIWLGTGVAKKTFEGPSNPDFLQQVSILAGLSHPNIVPLLWCTTDKKRSHMIMELMDGNLFTLMQERMKEYIDRNSPFSIFEAFVLLLQIAEGMRYLHEKRIVHRDLKSWNILVKSRKVRELDFKHVQVKVAGFGLSVTMEKSLTHSEQTQCVGTTRWMAPEVMALRNGGDEVVEAGPKNPFKSDVYSFGMVCFEIFTGDVPFSTVNLRDVRSVVLGGGRPELPTLCPSRLRTLIEACWSADPRKRPDFGHICAELRHLKYGLLMTCIQG